MAYIEHYADYKWIKVKRYDGWDANIPADENYAKLQRHHELETNFMINEIRKLAAMLDERDKRIEELAKNQKDPWPPEEWAAH